MVCLDSSAPRHMCNDPKKFSRLDDADKCKIRTASEHSMKSTGSDTVKLNIMSKDGNINQIKLQNTLLVPKFRNNLLSVPCVTNNGYIVTFTKYFAEVKRKKGAIAMKAIKKSQLYVVNVAQMTYANNIITNTTTSKHKKQIRWRERYGHLNFRDLNKFIRENMETKMDMKPTRDHFICEVCNKGKIH